MRKFLLSTLFAVLGASVAFAQDEAPSSVVETYRDWTVRCVPQEEGRTCQMVQELAQRESGQRILSLVIDAPEADDLVTATLVAPFGLRLADGITTRVDGGAAKPFAFSTCLPVGCVVAIDMDEAMIAEMKSGEALVLGMVSITNGQVVNAELSLAGFTAALNRLKALAIQGS